MSKFMINSPMRFFFLFAGTVIWLGIWLTGLETAHWLLYVPAVFFYYRYLPRHHFFSFPFSRLAQELNHCPIG
jgi:hypothetical protein